MENRPHLSLVFFIIIIMRCHTGRRWRSCLSIDLGPWYPSITSFGDLFNVPSCQTVHDFVFSLGLSLLSSYLSFLLVFSSPALLTLCPMNEDCCFLIHLIRFLSSFAFAWHYQSVILAVHGNLNILLFPLVIFLPLLDVTCELCDTWDFTPLSLLHSCWYSEAGREVRDGLVHPWTLMTVRPLTPTV